VRGGRLFLGLDRLDRLVVIPRIKPREVLDMHLEGLDIRKLEREKTTEVGSPAKKGG
jgi:hypothetical protein